MVGPLKFPARAWLNLPLRSIRGRLALLFGLAFLPAGLIAADAGLSAYESRQTAYHQTIGASQLGSMAAARDLVTRLRTAGRTLSANAALFAFDKTDCDTTLSHFAQEEPTIGMVSVLRPNLEVLCSNMPSVDGSVIDVKPLVNAALRSDDVVVGFVADPQKNGAPVIAAAAPAQMNNSKVSRVVYVSTPLQNVLKVHREIKDARNPYTALVNARGDILVLSNLALSSSEGQRLKTALRAKPPTQRQSAFQVDKTWAVSTPLDNGQLFLLTGWQAASPSWLEFLIAAWALIAPILLWAAAVTGVWIAIEVFVVRPLQVIEDLARAYARNEDTQAYEALLEDAPSEIFSLRRSLSALARTLRGRELRLTDALAEQKTLLLEVHHRVKNNLQLITSLLSIQARTSDEMEARVLNRANERIQLLSLAHNLIYNSVEVRGVALNRLAEEVGQTLIAARQSRGRNVHLETNLDSVRAATDVAVPFAFLLGETLSSLLDETTDAGVKTSISMRMEKRDGGDVRIELVKLNATRPANLDTASQRIIAAFATQIGATVEFTTDINSSVVVQISPEKLQGLRGGPPKQAANAAADAPPVRVS